MIDRMMIDRTTPPIPEYLKEARIILSLVEDGGTVFLYAAWNGEKWFFVVNRNQGCWKTLRKATEDEIRLIEGPHGT